MVRQGSQSADSTYPFAFSADPDPSRIERDPNRPIPSQIALDPSDPSPIPPITIKKRK